MTCITVTFRLNKTVPNRYNIIHCKYHFIILNMVGQWKQLQIFLFPCVLSVQMISIIKAGFDYITNSIHKYKYVALLPDSFKHRHTDRQTDRHTPLIGHWPRQTRNSGRLLLPFPLINQVHPLTYHWYLSSQYYVYEIIVKSHGIYIPALIWLIYSYWVLHWVKEKRPYLLA